MTAEFRLPDYLDHIRCAALEACGYIEGMKKTDFLSDARTQRAVTMNLIMIGEATTKIMGHYPEFAAAHPEIDWRSMRGMRNRIAHGYFDIDVHVVWHTVHVILPELLSILPVVEDGFQTM